jgi:hypothetical protein
VTVLVCTLLVVPAGVCGIGRASLPAGLSIRIDLQTSDAQFQFGRPQTFSLTCNPPADTLPLARRICRDIAAYPELMLSPGQKGGICPSAPGMPWVRVHITADGGPTQMSSGPGIYCGPNLAPALYFAAATNPAWLSSLESRFRCEMDRVVHGDAVSRQACRFGQWTRASERAIRVARQARALDVLDRAGLFPRDVGAHRCFIPAGVPARARTVYGQCGVLLKTTAGSTVVTFVEYWGTGQLAFDGGGFDRFASDESGKRHSWHVTIRDNRVVAVTESGAVPPQLWR